MFEETEDIFTDEQLSDFLTAYSFEVATWTERHIVERVEFFQKLKLHIPPTYFAEGGIYEKDYNIVRGYVDVESLEQQLELKLGKPSGIPENTLTFLLGLGVRGASLAIPTMLGRIISDVKSAVGCKQSVREPIGTYDVPIDSEGFPIMTSSSEDPMSDDDLEFRNLDQSYTRHDQQSTPPHQSTSRVAAAADNFRNLINDAKLKHKEVASSSPGPKVELTRQQKKREKKKLRKAEKKRATDLEKKDTMEIEVTSISPPPLKQPKQDSKRPVSPSKSPLQPVESTPGTGFQNYSSNLSPTAPSYNPTKKKKDDPNLDHAQVITGYIPQGECLQFVKDLIVYDVPATWDNLKILQELQTWGKVISMSRKAQKKYQTIRVKLELNRNIFEAYDKGDWIAPLADLPVRWFPAAWTLQERKERERFQAALYDIPDSLTMPALIPSCQIHPLIHTNLIKAFKVVQTPDKKRKLIAYLESWSTLSCLIGKKIDWNGVTLDWCRHSPPQISNYRNKSKKTPKNRSKSSSRQPDPKIAQGSATGSNRLPIGSNKKSNHLHKDSHPDVKKKKPKDSKGKRKESHRSGTKKPSRRQLQAELLEIRGILEKLVSKTLK